MNPEEVRIEFMPRVTEDQLWDFYVRNDICEVGYGKETAVIPLRHDPYMVCAFCGDQLVGIIRAAFDGLTADIREFCLECSLQGDDLKYRNGSLIEKDDHGIARRMGQLLIDELRKLGNTFTTGYLVENLEEETYRAIGLEHNRGHLVYYRDERPYVT